MTRATAAETIAYWAGHGIDASVTRGIGWAGNAPDHSIIPVYSLEERVRPCHRALREMYVSASGKAILCCCDWKEEVVFGDTRETSLLSIWNGEDYRLYRRKHLARDIGALHLCGTCDYSRARGREIVAEGKEEYIQTADGVRNSNRGNVELWIDPPFRKAGEIPAQDPTEAFGIKR